MHTMTYTRSSQALVFQSTGSGRLRDVLVKVLGLEAAMQMVPVGTQNEDPEPAFHEIDGRPETPQVGGYVGLPSLSRSNRNQIIVTEEGRNFGMISQ